MKTFLFFGLLVAMASVEAQEAWTVSTEDADRISQFRFDEDFALQGQGLYDNYCASCHGNASEGNYVLMVPSPGDVATDRFKVMKDGELLTKIKMGRGGMPAFNDVLGEDELWSLVAYMRTFHKGYVQPEFLMEGVHIAELSVEATFDDNVDKLVVKAIADGLPAAGIKVTAFIKGYFGNLKLGSSESNELGLAFFDVDTKMPGDSVGNLTFILKSQFGYAYGKETAVLQVATPKTKHAITDGRHLWSTNKQAPLWLKGSFYIVVLGIWAILIMVVLGLLRLKKIQ